MTTPFAMEQKEPTVQLMIVQSYPQNECRSKVELTMVEPASTLDDRSIRLSMIALPRIFFMNLDQRYKGFMPEKLPSFFVTPRWLDS